MLKVGKVSYLNALPLFYKLSDFHIVEGVPSQLVEMLRKGKIDAGIVSSVEYFFNPENYYILSDISISSRGSVCSVKLFSEKPIEKVERVKITKASLTSKYLLYYIFEEVLGKEVREEEGEEAVLLIGDEAMNYEGKKYVYDLGEIWYKIHGLPFVFALFLVRRNVEKSLAEKLKNELKKSLKSFFEDLEKGKFKENFYFKECIDYELKDEHLKSLNIFFDYLAKRFKKEKPRFEMI